MHILLNVKRISKNVKLSYKVGMQLDRNSYAIVDDRQTSSLTSTPDWVWWSLVSTDEGRVMLADEVKPTIQLVCGV